MLRRRPWLKKKVVLIAVAIEDDTQRDSLKGQSLPPRAPYEFIDMSVKEPYDEDWKDPVRTRIKRADGVIALVSKSSLKSNGQKWETICAKEGKSASAVLGPTRIICGTPLCKVSLANLPY